MKIPAGTRIALAIVLALVGLFFGLRWMAWWRLDHRRTAWKNQALPRLAALSNTNAGIRKELDALKSTGGEHAEWIADHVLLMTNGEFLVYAFHHGLNEGPVDHLFLARGSDGRWLYSTYHFCSEMQGIRGDDPPGSIAEFVARYSARQFDGQSDECLKHTWPPGR